MAFISKAERKFICDGIAQGVRNDGRRNNQKIELETNILMQSHGSARVRFAEGGTDVITSVRVETANYSEVMDPRDQIDVSLVFTASSSPSFLTRERSVEGELIAESIRKSAFLLSLTDRVLTSPGVMDLDELIIVKGLFCWKIDIDIQVYGDSGNVFDLAMLSVAAALRVTRIPCTVPVKNYEQEEKDFEIDDDATHFRRLSCMAVPISISICKVGKSIIVDASKEEQYCLDSWIFVCVNRRKEIVSVQNQQGRVDNDTLLGSLQVASDVSTELFQLIDTVIEKDDMKWTSSILPTKRGLFV